MGSGFLGTLSTRHRGRGCQSGWLSRGLRQALVSLPAEVARTYVRIRTLEKRLGIAFNNIEMQRESLRIAAVRFKHGATTELDVQQALTALSETEATVPSIQGALRQGKNGLSILLGLPPGELGGMLAGPRQGPGCPGKSCRGHTGRTAAPSARCPQGGIAGRRPKRPDRHRGNRSLSEFLPDRIDWLRDQRYRRQQRRRPVRFRQSQLRRRAGVQLEHPQLRTPHEQRPGPGCPLSADDRELPEHRAGRLREAEDAMAAIVQSQEESAYRQNAAEAASRSTEIAQIQYRQGSVDFQRVLDSERPWSCKRNAGC